MAAEQTYKFLRDRAIERFASSMVQSTVFLQDGQVSLWGMKEKFFGTEVGVEILDLLHANGYMWEAAILLYPDDKAQQFAFMKDKILKMLQGGIKRIIGGFRQMITKGALEKHQAERLSKICNYFERNAERMRYDDFLAAGYPIATGVIEGACRHYVKDRMERTGMRWTMVGAQEMLDMRSIFINDDWDSFHAFRIEHEIQELYSYKKMFETIKWPLAA